MLRKEFQPLIVPRISWEKNTIGLTCGELIAQPLEPGFGFTLGGALRRVLLGGIEGFAVSSIIIEGVNNEFSSLPGIVEDCMQIVLNCKGILVRSSDGKSGKMKLRFKGEGVAKVGDIKADANLSVVNPDHVIANVSKGGVLNIDFFVEAGRGYVMAKWPLDSSLSEDGRIYLDSMFSPVKRVTFTVEKTRVGKNIDYDKLSLMVLTDGTYSPTEVFHYGVSVLRGQLGCFLDAPEISFNEASEEDGVVEERQSVSEGGLTVDVAELLLKPVDSLEFSVRAHRCLENAGIDRVIDLVNLKEEAVLKIKNFGMKSFEEVEKGLKVFDLSFGMSINEAEVKAFLKKEKGK